MKKYSYTALASMVSMSMTLIVCQSVTHASDIEIYSNSTNGKTTISLMLDTSGSMSVGQVGSSACDIPSGSTGTVTTGSVSSVTTPSYTRSYCEVGGGDERRYYFKRSARLNNNYTWYTCVDINGSTDRGQCNHGIATTPNVDDYTARRFNSNGNAQNCNNNNECFYFKDVTISGKIYYDRLTRLKDAIFALLDSNLIDPTRVSIGVGNFSAQSESDNVYTSADGSSGKMLVPAALLQMHMQKLVLIC